MLANTQRALVTGASSGIGQAIAIALAARGLHVILVGRDASRLRHTSEKAGPNTNVLVADLTTEAGRDFAAERALPALHVLVHSAGQYYRSQTDTMTAAEWTALDAINVRAPILLTTLCMPLLRSASGQVVFINSSAALSAGPGLAAYSAGKRALQAATDVLRQEVNGDGVRVLSVFAGRTETAMQRKILEGEGRTMSPGTLLQPSDIADIVVACLSLPRTAEVTDIFVRPMRKL